MIKDMTGKKLNKLLVLKRVDNDKYGNARWLCKCDCGKSVVCNGQSIRSGRAKSCGCLQKLSARLLAYKHGESKTRLFKAWAAMKGRCFNKNDVSYKNYGGKGITICKEWLDFLTFKDWALKNGYREGLTIDRINVNGNYEPTNCRYVTRAEQNRNTTRNIKVHYKGKEVTISELSRIIKVQKWRLLTLYHRNKEDFIKSINL